MRHIQFFASSSLVASTVACAVIVLAASLAFLFSDAAHDSNHRQNSLPSRSADSEEQQKRQKEQIKDDAMHAIFDDALSGNKYPNSSLPNVQFKDFADHERSRAYNEAMRDLEAVNSGNPVDDCCLPKYAGLNCTQHVAESPCIPCELLSDEFIQCEDASELNLLGNYSAKIGGYGCIRYGGERWEDVERTKVKCSVLAVGIECRGPRKFYRYDVPCVKYTGHYFLSTLLYSILLGIFGIDRFCLGHACSGIGKLLTVGGLGLWWIIDIVLLCTGHLMPADGSNWEIYY